MLISSYCSEGDSRLAGGKMFLLLTNSGIFTKIFWIGESSDESTSKKPIFFLAAIGEVRPIPKQPGQDLSTGKHI